MARILVADDASFMRQMIREIVESEGFEVCGEASDGIEAIDEYKRLQPDVVTMDIVMPRKSGIDAVRGIIDRFCDGSVENLLVGMVDDKLLSPDKLRQLAQKIAEAEAAEKPKRRKKS